VATDHDNLTRRCRGEQRAASRVQERLQGRQRLAQQVVRLVKSHKNRVTLLQVFSFASLPELLRDDRATRRTRWRTNWRLQDRVSHGIGRGWRGIYLAGTSELGTQSRAYELLPEALDGAERQPVVFSNRGKRSCLGLKSPEHLDGYEIGAEGTAIHGDGVHRSA